MLTFDCETDCLVCPVHIQQPSFSSLSPLYSEEPHSPCLWQWHPYHPVSIQDVRGCPVRLLWTPCAKSTFMPPFRHKPDRGGGHWLHFSGCYWGMMRVSVNIHFTVISDSCSTITFLPLQKVRSECQDWQSCHIPVLSRVFGQDPCPLTTKYLLVSYKCQPGTH